MIVEKFNIKNNNKLIIISDEKKEYLYRFDFVKTFLKTKNTTYSLSKDNIQGSIFTWHLLLKEVIDDVLTLDNSLDYNLGYMWQNYLALASQQNYQPHENLHFKKIEKENSRWIGLKYLAFSSSYNHLPTANLWLYNSNDGKIILEVTPAYKWHFTEPKPHDGFIPFAEFIRNYKPILKTEISHSQAQQWLNQTEDFLKIVHDNDPFGGFL